MILKILSDLVIFASPVIIFLLYVLYFKPF